MNREYKENQKRNPEENPMLAKRTSNGVAAQENPMFFLIEFQT